MTYFCDTCDRIARFQTCDFCTMECRKVPEGIGPDNGYYCESEDDGYAPDDPKSPSYAAALVDWGDMDKKIRRGE